MNKVKKLSLFLAAAIAVFMPAFSFQKTEKTVYAAEIKTTATGYDSADDVVYKTAGGYTVNWGARGEDCVFLSSRAVSFYTGNYTYTTLSKNKGGSSQSNAPSSALYSALKNMMIAKHKTQTSYGATRDMYKYTDCVSNNYSQISSFYSGITLSGTWDSGKTWNREHTWPNSKGLGGNDENDIMMLRPTSVKENSSRGNTAYGQSGSYYDPGESVRGDCARIVLYVYVRWGNTSNMWGTSGVMENLNVLLKWMEEDPVDTWEMGRNDSVQSITGTRNVFVDYPEYAWLLFGKAIPENMSTPSGIANDQQVVTPPENSSSSSEVVTPPENSSSSSEVVTPPENSSSSPEVVIPPVVTPPENSSSSSEIETPPATSGGHTHTFGEWFTTKEPTETEDGYEMRVCSACQSIEIKPIPATGTGNPDSVPSDTIINPSASNVASSCGASITAPFVGIFLMTALGFITLKRK